MARKKTVKAKTKEELLQLELDRLRNEYVYVNNPPTHRIFKVGDRVKVGSLEDCLVEEVLDDGKFILVNYTKIENNYGDPIRNKNQKSYCYWMDVFHLSHNMSDEIFLKEDDIRISYSQRYMSGLFTHAYHFGFDLNPEYQRGRVWGLEDKVALIDSIFNNVDIGKFTFVKPDNIMELHEVLDGKQRLTALLEFYEDRFKYNGKYFSELNWRDKNHIKTYTINWGETSGLTRE
ncbi:MAG: DUF262 domain-containing protein, partial [Peptostreptococcaceae bacterium]